MGFRVLKKCALFTFSTKGGGTRFLQPLVLIYETMWQRVSGNHDFPA